MKKYEYEVIIFHPTDNAKKKLNDLGGQGWQLVQMDGRTFYFIRESRGEQNA